VAARLLCAWVAAAEIERSAVGSSERKSIETPEPSMFIMAAL
jgi:hypothetical protein